MTAGIQHTYTRSDFLLFFWLGREKKKYTSLLWSLSMSQAPEQAVSWQLHIIKHYKDFLDKKSKRTLRIFPHIASPGSFTMPKYCLWNSSVLRGDLMLARFQWGSFITLSDSFHLHFLSLHSIPAPYGSKIEVCNHGAWMTFPALTTTGNHSLTEDK